MRIGKIMKRTGAFALALLLAAGSIPADAARAAAVDEGWNFSVSGGAADAALLDSQKAEGKQRAVSAYSLAASSDLKNGTITISEKTAAQGSKVSVTAVPAEHYDLATVRAIYTQNGSKKELYADLSQAAGKNEYTASFTMPAANVTVTATFFSETVWDGAVDVSWYDPEATTYEIGTPAQLAGLAAIVNGMVDEKITTPDMIKGDGDTYIQCEKITDSELTSQQGGGVDDISYRLPEIVKKNPLAADDNRNDMKYRTILLTSDIDMGKLNYTPIGGKYAMNVTAASGDVKVVDARFQGIFDGQGHTVTINCDRYSPKGFAYSMAIGMIGYLGGNLGGGAKDSQINYAMAGYKPTVRNVIVAGSVRGRRMVGGIVGRIGQTNNGVIIENCGNKARISSTDMRGAAGIAATAWGYGTIRNCYNLGDVSAEFDEAGGICGSNGYEKQAVDIYNCYNAGNIVVAGEYGGKEIGTDGEGGGVYTVSNCYYKAPAEGQTSKTEGYDKANNGNASVAMNALTEADMKSDGFLAKLNTNGAAFETVSGKNNGYPVLFYEAEGSRPAHTVAVGSASNGNVSADHVGVFPYGTTITFANEADSGFILRNYQINGKAIAHDYYTLTEDITVSGTFESRKAVSLIFPDAQGKYEVTARRIANQAGTADESLSDGASLNEGDIIQISASIADKAMPDDVNLEFTGDFETPQFRDKKTVKADEKNTNVFEVTGEGDLELIITPKTQGKRWVSIADTSWYSPKETVFTLTTAKQLAGMAKLLYDGTDTFKGKTIILGNDIDLKNPDGTGGNRNWSIAGGMREGQKFKGTFDGKGHKITNLFRDFNSKICSGSYGGLFAFTSEAVIQNVTIEGSFVRATADSGGIVGTAENTRILNCVSRVNMGVAKSCGGIAGEADSGTLIENCVSEGELKGISELGGIVGKTVGYGTTGVTIRSCTNKGSISGSAYRTGGIVANCSGNTTISKCINTGSVTASQSLSSYNSMQAAGGIVASVSTSAKTVIEQCYNTGAVTGENCLPSVGGIVGFLGNRNSVLQNCYNKGKVHCDGESSNARLGGIANMGDYETIVVKSCYNTGAVTKGAKFKTASVGGCFGTGKGVKYGTNYCLNTAAAGVGGKAGVSGKLVSAASLKGAAASLGAAYCADDTPALNGGYPVFCWQAYTKPVKGVKISSTALTFTAKGTKNLTGSVVPSCAGNAKVIWKSSDASVASVNSKGTVTAKKDGVCTITATSSVGGFRATCKVVVGIIKSTAFTGAASKGYNSVRLTWKKASGAGGYIIYRSASKASGYKTVRTITKGSTVSYTNSGLTTGKTYYYKIKAYKTVKGNKVYSSLSAARAGKAVLPKATLSSVKNTKGRKAALKWKKVTGASGYVIYRKTGSKGKYKAVKTVNKGSTVQWTNSGLKKKTKYYYKIRAYRTVSKKKVYGAYSAVKAVKISK